MIDIDKKWEEAVRTGEQVDIGDLVVCDSCNDDYTCSLKCGGLIFGSKAYCPTCTPRLLNDVEKYGEQRYIRAHCRQLQTFADFVREYRGGNNSIKATIL